MLRLIRIGGTVQPKVPAPRSHRTLAPSHKSLCHLPLVPRAYSFFSSVSCRISIPSSLSASIRFKRAFSFSSSFIRLAWSTSIIPNSRFQRWKVCSLMLFSRHASRIVFPLSACRSIRIFSSVVYLLPFIVCVLSRLPRLTFQVYQFSWSRPYPNKRAITVQCKVTAARPPVPPLAYRFISILNERDQHQ